MNGSSRSNVADYDSACPSHSYRARQWLHPSHGRDVTGPYADVPYDGNLTMVDGAGMWWDGLDPQDLYGSRHDGDPQEPDESYMQRGVPPDLRYRDNWLARTTELVQKYEPDLLYFDGPLPFGEYGLRLAAEFYNRNRRRHGGKLEAVLNVKSWRPGTVPDESAIVLDIEKGLSGVGRQSAWQADTSILPDWVYTPGPHALSDTVIIHNLCDIVSKNGNLLLNVSPRADGTLPRGNHSVSRGGLPGLTGDAVADSVEDVDAVLAEG